MKLREFGWVCGLTVLALASVARSAPVLFGTPDQTSLRDGETSTWSMAVPGNPTPDPGSPWIGQMLFHAINTKGAGANVGITMDVLPEPLGHAINTKGAGANVGIVMSENSGMSLVADPSVVGGDLDSDNDGISYLFRFNLVDSTGTGSYSPIYLELTGSTLAGAYLASPPTVSVNSAGNGLDISYDLVPSSVADVTAPSFQMQLSAVTAVPEPGTAAVLGLTAVGLMRRRRA